MSNVAFLLSDKERSAKNKETNKQIKQIVTCLAYK